MKSYSFADAYALGLIARDPSDDWSQIRAHLSEDARKIADEIISPGHGSRETKSAAKALLTQAEKIRNCPSI
jgi:hypothetical protein